jgi:hypothetical protein
MNGNVFWPFEEGQIEIALCDALVGLNEEQQLIQ